MMNLVMFFFCYIRECVRAASKLGRTQSFSASQGWAAVRQIGRVAGQSNVGRRHRR